VRRASWWARLAIAVLVITLAASGAVSGIVPPPASAASPPAASQSAASQSPAATSYSLIDATLFGVAAISPRDAWAVGYSYAGPSRTLLLHWNGVKWSQVTSPKPVTGLLYAVTAVSANDVWAVGSTADDTILILHWNGKMWRREAGVPPIHNQTGAVAATKNSVWIATRSESLEVTVTLHWTKGRWYVVPLSDPLATSYMIGIAIAGSAVWGVGAAGSDNSTCPRPKLWRWSGSAWKTVSFPLPSSYCGQFQGITTGPRGTALVVGWVSPCSTFNCAPEPFTMQWNGKTWRKLPFATKDVGPYAVASVPDGTAWAIYSAGIYRWAGGAWRLAKTLTPASSGYALEAVAASSARDAWAVGSWEPGVQRSMTLIVHWNGKAWS
jgi:hypothetical protein